MARPVAAAITTIDCRCARSATVGPRRYPIVGAQVTVELILPGLDALGRSFLTWTPVEARARLLNPVGTSPVGTTLRSVGTVGRVRFATTRTHLGTPTLRLDLPVDGAPVGSCSRGSSASERHAGDAALEARGRRPGVVGSRPVMVRVRKDAETLTAAERDRFLAAFGRSTTAASAASATSVTCTPRSDRPGGARRAGFLPWHRAYLLDLERELQAIDPSVALPYWRFDRPAPKVFTRASWASRTPPARLQFTPEPVPVLDAPTVGRGSPGSRVRPPDRVGP